LDSILEGNFTVRFSGVNTGVFILLTRMVIQFTENNECCIHSVYGFGSFFRQEKYNDIDLLFVLSDQGEGILTACNKINEFCFCLDERFQETIHPLIFTVSEMLSRPLRNMEQLSFISGKTSLL